MKNSDYIEQESDAKILYLNWKGERGVETIEEVTQKPDQSHGDFMTYVRSIKNTYYEHGINLFISPCSYN